MIRTAATLFAAISEMASYTVAPGATEWISWPFFFRIEPIDSEMGFYLPLRTKLRGLAQLCS